MYDLEKADFADYVIGLRNREMKGDVTYTLDRRAAGNDLFKVVFPS